MTRVPTLTLILWCAVVTAFSQVDLKFSGYVANFPIYQILKEPLATLTSSDRIQFVDVSRVRLRPSLDLSSNAFLMLEYEINATYFSSPILFLTQPQTRGQLADLTWNPDIGTHWSAVHYVDRLYLRQSSSIGDFTIGRQRISWGTGRVWNPTDLFNPINPTSFSKIEKDGVDAVLGKFVLGNFSDLSIVWNPIEEFRRSNTGGRLRTNIGGYDVSLVGGLFDERRIIGADFAGNIWDAGLRGEAIVSASRGSWRDNFVKYIIGVDNQFTQKLYAMAEFLYNGEGKSRPSEYEFQRLISGQILNLGREYLTGLVSYLVHPLATFSVSTTYAFTDCSGFLSATFAYSASDEAALTLGGQVFYGDEFDEYWWYPSTLYLRGDWFF